MKFRNLKKLESIVFEILELDKTSRKDDFKLYLEVLKSIGINENMTIGTFFSVAKKYNIPAFESVTRCRRHLQQLNSKLKDFKTSIAREDEVEEYKTYNISGIGGN